MRLYKSKLSVGVIIVSLMGSCAFADEENLTRNYSWSGLYLGAFVGGAAGSSTNTTEPLRLDNLTYWFRPFSNSYGYNLTASATAGGTVGYNWQVLQSPLYVGVEGEYGYLHQSGAGSDINQGPYGALTNNLPSNIGRHWTDIGSSYGYGLIGGRVGYAFDRLLVYVKSGAVFTKIKTAYNSIKVEDNIFPLPNISTSSAVDKVGFSIGGGIEYAPSMFENVSVKAEYLYLGINNTQPSYGYCSCHFLWRTVDQIGAVHTAKVGINFRVPGLVF